MSTYEEAKLNLHTYKPVNHPAIKPTDETQVWELSVLVVDALALLDTDSMPEAAWHEEVIKILAIVPLKLRARVFWEVDDKPGVFGYERDGQEWHWKLRRTRNHTIYGPCLYKELRND